jgi:hypothetical protein
VQQILPWRQKARPHSSPAGARQREAGTPARRWASARAALLSLPALLCAGLAAAAPWNQDEGHGVVILQATPYWANVPGYDTTGRPSMRGSVNRIEISPYWEHGLTPRWTVGLAPRLQSLWLDDRRNVNTNTGVAEVAAFARFQVYRGEWDVFSVQGTILTPGFDRLGRNPRVGEPNMGTEIRALYGISSNYGEGRSIFASVEAAHRFRFGASADEVRLDATVGIRPFDNWMFFAQSFNTIGLRNARANGADYSISKIQVTAAYDLNETYSISLGFMREIDGRRVPLGQAAILGLWVRY